MVKYLLRDDDLSVTYISHLAYIEYINLAMNTISNMNNKINLNEVQSRFS